MLVHILPILVAIEAIIIMYIEMFASTKLQAKSFGLKEDFVNIPETKVLLANQGIYNGLLGILILGTTFLLKGHAQLLMLIMEMLFILIAAIYGGFTANKKIILIQGLPAALALLILIFL